MTIPYTYYLYHKPTGLKYYGVRYAKNCNPDDLWNKYFSSSKKVKALIAKYGINSFDYKIRKTFKTKKESLIWESKVLKKLKVSTNDEWININENIPEPYTKEYNEKLKKKKSEISKRLQAEGKIGMKGKKHSAYSKRKIAEAQKGEKNHMYGKTHTEESKKKIAEASKKQIWNDERRKKISKSNKGRDIGFSKGMKHSDESIDKIKKARAKQIFSEESKRKMSESAKGRKWYKCPETDKRIFYREGEY